MMLSLLLLLPVLAPAQEPAPKAAPEATPGAERFHEFALLVEESINSLDPRVLDGAFDHEVFMERVRGDLRVPEAMHRAFTQALSTSLLLGAELCSAIETDGSYLLLGLHREAEGVDLWRARYRLLTGGSLNYHELLLSPGRDGEGIRILDCFVYLSGEELSDSVRRNYVQVVASGERTLTARLFGEDPAFVRHVDELLRMQQAISAGRSRQALAVYDRLPPELQREKNVLLLRIQAAQQVGDDAYLEALRDYRRTYPDEPRMDLLLLDVHFMDGAYDEALACIDRLDERVEGDPYLDCLRSNLHFARGDKAEARKLVRRAIERDPSLEEARWIFLDQALAGDDFPAVVEALEALEERFGYWFEDLDTLEGFEAFVESEEYDAWLETRS